MPMMPPIRKMLRQLKEDEGLKLKPYRCTEGKLTIGIGRNLDDVGITEEEAEFLCKNDIERVFNQLAHFLPWTTDLDPGRQCALANMVFQLGIGNVMKFKKMLRALKAGDYDGAYAEALNSQWAQQTPNRAQRVAQQLRDGERE